METVFDIVGSGVKDVGVELSSAGRCLDGGWLISKQ